MTGEDFETLKDIIIKLLNRNSKRIDNKTNYGYKITGYRMTDKIIRIDIKDELIFEQRKELDDFKETIVNDEDLPF